MSGNSFNQYATKIPFREKRSLISVKLPAHSTGIPIAPNKPYRFSSAGRYPLEHYGISPMKGVIPGLTRNLVFSGFHFRGHDAFCHDQCWCVCFPKERRGVDPEKAKT